MAKKTKREIEAKKFNDKISRLSRTYGIDKNLMPSKITKDQVKKLTYREIQKMSEALKKANLTGENVFEATKRSGESIAYTKAQLDIANIKIKAENRERRKQRKEIAEKEVHYARQSKQKGVEGARKNKFVEEYAGLRKEMADLTRLGLEDIKEIPLANPEGKVDTFTRIHSAERKFERNQAELYKENILDSLAWSLGGEKGEELLDAVKNTDAEVLLDMYYSSNELDIADWYVKEGFDDSEIANVVEQNAFALSSWANRVEKTGKYQPEQYEALKNLHKKLYGKHKTPYVSENRQNYNERRMRIATKNDSLKK